MVDCAEFSDAVVFLCYFEDMKDPRQQSKVTYPLDEVLLLCLLAVLIGAETFRDIALFSCKKLDLSCRFRPFKDGAQRTIISATSWPCLTPSNSSAAGSPR